MQLLMTTTSDWLLPCIITAILIGGFIKRVPIYNTFVEGAKSGFGTSIKLIPHLVAMMIAVSVFRASGALDFIIQFITPVLNLLHIPPEVAPMGLLRPISGQGSLALMIDLFKQPGHGPDSPLGLLASTVQASSDTTLYIITVYFGSVGIQNIRYALKVGFLADFFTVLASVFAVYLLFGGLHA